MPSLAALPPGFRFHPTDEELILHYLRKRAAAAPCPVSIIAEVDIYKFDPWDLPAKAIFGDKEWYFFSPRDRKYPNGIRPNRAAASGYWKATGTDKPIQAGAEGGESIGVKKALVFYKGRPPKGLKTNWIMHEYRLAEAPGSNSYRPMKFKDSSMRLDDWVLCRIYKKSLQSSPMMEPADPQQDDSASADDIYAASLRSYAPPSGAGGGRTMPKPPSISDYLEDFSAVSALFDTLPEAPPCDGQSQFLIGESPQKRLRSSTEGFLEDGNGVSTMPDTMSNSTSQLDGFSQSLMSQSFSGQHMMLNPRFGSQ